MRKRFNGARSIAAVVLAASVGASHGNAGLERIPEEMQLALPELTNVHWYESQGTWIAVADRALAEHAADELRAATKTYEQYFGQPAPGGAIVDSEYLGQLESVEAAGADWVLAYPFASVEQTVSGSDGGASGEESKAASVRSQIEAQLKAAGIEKSDKDIDAMVDRALSKVSQASDDEVPPDPRKALRHEIAHKLFTVGQWGSTGGKGGGYGSGAPDWLDETAAVLAEGDDLTRARRKRFRQMVAEGTVIALPRYFTMKHPMTDSRVVERARRQAKAKGAAAVVVSSDDVETGEALLFYAQARGFADFLLDRSPDSTVFSDITAALMGGADMGAWLRQHGAKHNLPTDIPSLERALMAWAKRQPYAESDKRGRP